MKRPIILINIFLIVGILLGFYFDISKEILLAFLGGTFILAVTIREKYFLAGLFLILGILLSQRAYSISNVLSYEDQSIEIVMDVYDVYAVDEKTSRYDGIIRLLNGQPREEKTSFFADRGMGFQIGDRLEGYGTVSRPQGATNPKLFDYNIYLRTRGIYSILQIQPWTIEKTGLSDDVLLHLRRNFFSFVEESFSKYLSKDDADLMRSVIIGRDDVGEQTSDNYRKLGLSHLMAASGMHLTLISSIIVFIILRIGLHRKIALLLAAGAAVFYTYLIGAPGSILRATIMFLLMVLSFLRLKPFDSLNALFVSSFIILWVNPYAIFSVGFQLSMLCTFAIIYVYPKLKKRFICDVVSIDSLLLVGSIQLTLLPVQLYYFNEIFLINLLANLLVVPIFSLATILAVSLLMMEFLLPPVAMILGVGLKSLLTGNALLIRGLLLLNDFRITWRSEGIAVILLFYMLLIGILNGYRIKSVPRRWLVKVLQFGMILSFCWGVSAGLNPSTGIQFIDIGQGDSILIQSRNGNYLLDTGGSLIPGDKIGERILLPYLYKQGIRRLDGVFISHEDSDHSGNLKILSENIDVNALYINEMNPKEIPPQIEHVVHLQAGDTFQMDEVRGKVIYAGESWAGNTNNTSTVLLFTARGVSLLFTGDIEADIERILASRNIKADILKIAHHGSASSTGEDFLENVDPRIAVISVGRNNRYGHPDKEVIDRLEHKKILTYRTDRDGLVQIKIGKSEIQIDPYIKPGQSLEKFVYNKKSAILYNVIFVCVFLYWIKLIQREKSYGL